jgi:large subunit ribosomal protein L18
MDKNRQKSVRRSRRRRGIRKRVIGTTERPRLAVFRSLNHIYAQVIDDLEGRTMVACSTRDKGVELSATGNAEAAAAVGTRLAEKAAQAGIKAVVFDRAGFKYHGRVRALADAARKGGLEF